MISKAIPQRALARPLVLILLIFLSGLPACQNLGVHDNSKRQNREAAFQQKIFFAPYESVWRAAQVALRYPISLNNMDNGALETDWIRALDGFIPPGKNRRVPSAGVRYRLLLTLVKGRYQGRESVKVSIKKVIQRQADFFADPQELQTDGLEEKVILYRIERELIIHEALKKVRPG